MTSMESGHARAASLMHAARRNHFVARIEKYEAKVRQDQKARAMLREQRAAVALFEQRPVVITGQQLCLVEKMAIPQPVEVGREQKCTREHEREDSPEQKTISEAKEMALEPFPIHGKLHRIASDSLNAVHSSTEVTNSIRIASVGNFRPLETKCSGGQYSIFTDVRPSAVIDVDIAAIASALKIRIKAVDMAASMQEYAFRCARNSLDTLDKRHCKRVAYLLKKEFDTVYGPAWHCIVGTNFGSYVTHSLGGFVYFSLDKVSVLLFKTTVEPIEH